MDVKLCNGTMIVKATDDEVEHAADEYLRSGGIMGGTRTFNAFMVMRADEERKWLARPRRHSMPPAMSCASGAGRRLS